MKKLNLEELLGMEVPPFIHKKYEFLFKLNTALFDEDNDITLYAREVLQQEYPEQYEWFKSMDNTHNITLHFILHLCFLLEIDFQELKF